MNEIKNKEFYLDFPREGVLFRVDNNGNIFKKAYDGKESSSPVSPHDELFVIAAKLGKKISYLEYIKGKSNRYDRPKKLLGDYYFIISGYRFYPLPIIVAISLFSFVAYKIWMYFKTGCFTSIGSATQSPIKYCGKTGGFVSLFETPFLIISVVLFFKSIKRDDRA